MRRWLRVLVMAAAAAAASAHAEGLWDRLWHNADQRGQALLQQGDAAAAAQAYSDPRHQAYAAMQAGDCRAAAAALAPLRDRDALYNRGNALARCGDLEAALAAYDAGLAIDGRDTDMRHNRDLVAKAIEQRKQQPSQSQQSQQQQQQSSSASKEPQQGSNPSGPAGAASGAASAPQAAPSPASNPSRSPEQAESARRGAAGASAPAAEQARRDAEAGLARAASPPPRSEKQLAEEEWLRRIPDDPGGLLRRKFMIEHLMRQRGTPP